MIQLMLAIISEVDAIRTTYKIAFFRNPAKFDSILQMNPLLAKYKFISITFYCAYNDF